MKIQSLIFVISLIIVGACSPQSHSGNPHNSHNPNDWPSYLGDLGRTHYSQLVDITPENVAQLEVVWTYHAGGKSADDRSQIQCNPIIVEGVLYATNPQLHLFALDAATGEERWTFNPSNDAGAGLGVNRGVTYWEAGEDKRILYTSSDQLFAIDATTGALVESFGEGGSVSLKDGLGRNPDDLFVISNTPGALYQDLLILGTRVHETYGAAPGHIRAYNVRSGEIVWTFHTIPQPGEFGYETWPEDAYQTFGGANSWAGITLDPELGMVYVPTGSASFDFYGGDRKGDNLFANTLLALDAATGERKWHFQTVHHDLWDRDLPAPPTLLTVQQGGKAVKAVAQPTKSGMLFVFDRISGEPLFPIEERSVPASTLIGEHASPTQPFPLKPKPFTRQHFPAELITDISPESHAAVSARHAQARTGGPYEPFSEQSTILFPGFDGGGEWGGAGADPEAGILYINANEMPWITHMVPLAGAKNAVQNGTIPDALAGAKDAYQINCANCHGADLQGQEGLYPSLANVSKKLSETEIISIIQKGQGVMPAFAHVSKEDQQKIAAFLSGRGGAEASVGKVTGDKKGPTPMYAFGGYNRFLDPEGYPAIKPPWGTLSAIDLNSGEFLWQVPLGEFEELTARGIPQTGTENYGGMVVTAGELIFIAATKDEKMRAFHKRTGSVLWETSLPAGGYATPSTYAVKGRQYVVIACGGGKMGTKSGDAYVAFALPE